MEKKKKAPTKKATPTKAPPTKAPPKTITQIVEKAPARPLIFSAINAAMKLIQPLAKTEKHPDQGFMFRRIDVLIAELQPILCAQHLFYAAEEVLSCEQVDRGVRLENGTSYVNIFTRIRVRYRLYCTLDGSSIPIEAVGEGVSEQQFSTNAAFTMAEKAMLCDVFAIPVYGDDDPESTSPEYSQGIVAPSAPVISTVPSTPAPVPENPGLFDSLPETAAPATASAKRRRISTSEPQVAAAGGAVAPDDAPAAPPPDQPIATGSKKIVQINLKQSKKEEKDFLTAMKVEKLDDLKQVDLTKAMEWIRG